MRKLTRANLDGANLTGADLDGANLTGANLSEVEITEPPLFIHGVSVYPLTAYSGTKGEKMVKIGCKLHTLAEWDVIFAANTYRNLLDTDEQYDAHRRAFEFAKAELLRG